MPLRYSNKRRWQRSVNSRGPSSNTRGTTTYRLLWVHVGRISQTGDPTPNMNKSWKWGWGIYPQQRMLKMKKYVPWSLLWTFELFLRERPQFYVLHYVLMLWMLYTRIFKDMEFLGRSVSLFVIFKAPAIYYLLIYLLNRLLVLFVERKRNWFRFLSWYYVPMSCSREECYYGEKVDWHSVCILWFYCYANYCLYYCCYNATELLLYNKSFGDYSMCFYF